MPDTPSPIKRPNSVEWPTVCLITTIYLSWLGLTVFHSSIPLWLWLPLAAWISAWWGSVQHEIVHGHPTRFRSLNKALATPPFSLWLPFECYRHSHLTHHIDENLTDPLDDPESRYWTSEDWKKLGRIGRFLIRAQGNLLGRLVIGPLWSIPVFWLDEWRASKLDHGRTRRVWARKVWILHLIWVALILVWVIAICKMPLWQYGLGFVYLGTSLSLIRSFAEHRARDHVDQRTAIVEKSWIFGLLFLHNNLHVVHHRWPTLPWYKLPATYKRNRDDVLIANDGLVYRGYFDVFYRYLFNRHDQPLHPKEREQLQLTIQAGSSYPAALASSSHSSVFAKSD